MTKIITQQEVIDLLKTSKVDDNEHLLVTNKTYTSYCNWFMSTVNERNKKDLKETKKLSPSKYKSWMCNIIAGSYQSVTKDFSPISTVCIGYTNGSLDYVNTKF
jgi:hypothetical protein